MKTVCILGLGYIGLPTACLFATHGLRVIGVDINPHIVQVLTDGDIHIREVGLRDLFRAAITSGNLIIKCAPEPADVFVIAVPTPIYPDKTADMRAVISATESLVPYLRPGNLVILESTSPPCTTVDLVMPILGRSGLKAGGDFMLVYSPERVLPGQILKEMVENVRIIGGIDRTSAEAGRDLYSAFVTGEILLTDATTAELVKLMENTYRDVNISLANSFARIGDVLGIDIWSAIALANRHPRVRILQPGPGVGGHCIAVDPWFIVEKTPNESKLIAMARMINDAMPVYVSQSIMSLIKPYSNPRVAVLGATYKANVDDTRESPALRVVDLLSRAGCQVCVHDPYIFPSIGLMDAVRGVDCLVLLVAHQEYADLEPRSLAEVMRHRIAFDTQNRLPDDIWHAAGFQLVKLGRDCGDIGDISFAEA